MQMSYGRFAAMIATSTVVMLLLMYLNTYALEHVFWSETRMWMALLMGASMAVIMLAYMLAMYPNRSANVAIFVGAALVFALSLWLVRSQATVSDADYMKAMIPHHSIAVLTSERAQISDPRVRKLADEIIAAQRREIAEMRYLIDDLQARQSDVTALHETTVPPRLAPAGQAVGQAEVAKVDLAALDAAEIERVLGSVRHCSFRYARSGQPVLAAGVPSGAGGTATGVVKLNGLLVRLVASYPAPASPVDGVELAGEGISVTVAPRGDDGDEADARLHLDAGLDVGYGGFYRCDAAGDAPA